LIGEGDEIRQVNWCFWPLAIWDLCQGPLVNPEVFCYAQESYIQSGFTILECMPMLTSWYTPTLPAFGYQARIWFPWCRFGL